MSALAGFAEGFADSFSAKKAQENAGKLAGQTMPGGFTGQPVGEVRYDDGMGIYAGTSGGRRSGGGGGTPISKDYLVNGLVERGLPRHVAQAFAVNFQDESGLDPGINEHSPLVPGSRGGFGLSQWTGPRRRALERFATDRGTDVSDPDMQMDFLMYELNGPERRAFDRMMATNTPSQAAVSIVNDFLRPHETHRARRASRYAGLPNTPSPEPMGIKPEPEPAWAKLRTGAAI